MFQIQDQSRPRDLSFGASVQVSRPDLQCSETCPSIHCNCTSFSPVSLGFGKKRKPSFQSACEAQRGWAGLYLYQASDRQRGRRLWWASGWAESTGGKGGSILPSRPLPASRLVARPNARVILKISSRARGDHGHMGHIEPLKSDIVQLFEVWGPELMAVPDIICFLKQPRQNWCPHFCRVTSWCSCSHSLQPSHWPEDSGLDSSRISISLSSFLIRQSLGYGLLVLSHRLGFDQDASLWIAIKTEMTRAFSGRHSCWNSLSPFTA